MANFHVGQKVVSLRTHFNKSGFVGVVKGEVYEIRRIEFYNEQKFLMFAEHPVILWRDGERGWDAEYFRPIVKTNIEIFTSMLTKPSIKVDA